MYTIHHDRVGFQDIHSKKLIHYDEHVNEYNHESYLKRVFLTLHFYRLRVKHGQPYL